MKNGKNLRDVQEEYQSSTVGLCCICQKPVMGWYGAWAEGGTCSKKCEQVREAQPRYPEHPERSES